MLICPLNWNIYRFIRKKITWYHFSFRIKRQESVSFWRAHAVISHLISSLHSLGGQRITRAVEWKHHQPHKRQQQNRRYRGEQWKVHGPTETRTLLSIEAAQPSMLKLDGVGLSAVTTAEWLISLGRSAFSCTIWNYIYSLQKPPSNFYGVNKWPCDFSGVVFAHLPIRRNLQNSYKFHSGNWLGSIQRLRKGTTKRKELASDGQYGVVFSEPSWCHRTSTSPWPQNSEFADVLLRIFRSLDAEISLNHWLIGPVDRQSHDSPSDAKRPESVTLPWIRAETAGNRFLCTTFEHVAVGVGASQIYQVKIDSKQTKLLFKCKSSIFTCNAHHFVDSSNGRRSAHDKRDDSRVNNNHLEGVRQNHCLQASLQGKENKMWLMFAGCVYMTWSSLLTVWSYWYQWCVKCADETDPQHGYPHRYSWNWI